ncbi:MAG: glycosyltransferase [Flavobacteriales bacterium]|nr:glycosyltransferase [Flavobacteriales bacterium]
MIKQVLYISYDGMTDPLGQSQVLPYLVGLSKEGFQFTLVSCEKRERYNTNKSIIEDVCFQYNIDWKPIFYTKTPPIFSTVWDIIKLNKRAKKLHQKKQFQLIHCRSYIPSLIGLAFKQKYGVKFIFDMRGFWADERVDGGIWNLKNPLYKQVYKYFKKKEKEYLTHADKIISLTDNGKKEMLNWEILNLHADKITVIPCAADYNLFELVTSDKREKAKYNLNVNNDEFVLSYIGSLGTWYLVDEMLLFFSILKSKYQDAKFLIITPDDKKTIYDLGRKYKLEPEDFRIQFVQRNQLPMVAYASNVSIFFIKPSYSKKASSPTKMGELLAMGIPIICNNNVGDVEEIINTTGGGFCITEMNEANFTKIVDSLEQFADFIGSHVREKSRDYYDLQKGLNLYISVYKELF